MLVCFMLTADALKRNSDSKTFGEAFEVYEATVKLQNWYIKIYINNWPFILISILNNEQSFRDKYVCW